MGLLLIKRFKYYDQKKNEWGPWNPSVTVVCFKYKCDRGGLISKLQFKPINDSYFTYISRIFKRFGIYNALF